MTAPSLRATANPLNERTLPLMLLLFIGSGCAALIYEVVWFQLLSLIVGSSAISMGIILGTFMGGMCLGSLYLPRWFSAREHPLRVYAKLELGIGICGLLILFGLPLLGKAYVVISGPGLSGMLLAAVLCAICLLPPTLMMGATLPAIARWVQTTPSGISWLGFFYGGNIAGAVAGSLLAGFYLLRVHDNSYATFAAAALNVVVAAMAFGIASRTSYATDDSGSTSTAKAPLFEMPPGTAPVYLTIALSGMTALGAEVIWTRLLSLTLGATVYTFSLILAAFLSGLGIGSSVGSMIARLTPNARMALGWCQALLVLAIGWAAISLSSWLPWWPIQPTLDYTPGALFQIDFVRCLWVVLPGACLWGASFPLALAAVAPSEKDSSRLVSSVYAANTVGAIVGSLVTALVLITWIGTQNAQRVLAVFAIVSAVVMFAHALRTKNAEAGGRLAAMWGAVLVIAGGGWITWKIERIPDALIGYGRWTAGYGWERGKILFTGEGMNSSMAVSQLSNGVLNYHNAGKIQASSEPKDMRLQRMLGHLTTLIPANPKNVLVIGCGAGVTAGAVSISPLVERETIAEIEPLVPKFVSKYFGEHNYKVVDNPKVHVQIDDARHFLLTTKEKFDGITSDPFDPWVKGAASLYTEEFFQTAKAHLNPGGVMTVFVQLYESGEPAVKSEIATFLKVFPNGIVWGNTSNGQGYDVVMMGRVDDTPIDVDMIQARLDSPKFAEVAQSLREIGFASAIELLSTFAGQGADMGPYLADAQINTDRNLRLQYLAGAGVNAYEQATIYRGILQARQFKPNLFTGGTESLKALWEAVMIRQ
ncbi:MAG: fused MFS/spermidine synthase [Gemmatimonadaceae bacterium]|nr:fused MFS/spermidine synthase [Gemmatimonadaceae bacterium]